MDIDVPIVGLRELTARVPDEAQRRLVAYRILERLVAVGEAEAKRRAAHRTGGLRRSIRHHGSMTEGYAVLQAEAIYAPFVEFGTGIYGPRHQRIQPAKTMRWPAGTMGPGGNLRLTGRPRAGEEAQFIFARSTKGMRPQPFMGPARVAIDAAAPQVLALAAAQLAGMLEERSSA